MSVDNGIHNQFDPSERPIFLDIAPGMTMIVRHDYLTGEKRDKDWWMGQVIHCGGSARDPKIHNLFQIADVDSGAIRWVNADLVRHVVTDPKTDCGHTGAMKRLNPIAAIAAASILLVGCLEGKELTKKQEPWAIPKGDAREDCTEFIALDDRFYSARDRKQKELEKAYAKYDLILEKSGFKAAEDWWRSDKNQFIAAEALVDKLRKELDMAKINVAKHMGYSKQRLQEMWERRVGDGPQFMANVKSKKLSEVIVDMGFPWTEIRSFCKKL